MLGELLGEQAHALVLLVHPLLNLVHHLLHGLGFEHCLVVEVVKRVFQMLFLPVHVQFQLDELVVFEFSFLLESLQFPFKDIFYFEVQGHAIVVDRVQDDRVGHDVAIVVAFRVGAATILDLPFQSLDLLFNVVLDYFDALNYYVLENSLPLILIYLIQIILRAKLVVDLVLDLLVHRVLLLNHCIHVASADPRAQWVTAVACPFLSRQVAKIHIGLTRAGSLHRGNGLRLVILHVKLVVAGVLLSDVVEHTPIEI